MVAPITSDRFLLGETAAHVSSFQWDESRFAKLWTAETFLPGDVPIDTRAIALNSTGSVAAVAAAPQTPNADFVPAIAF